LAAGRFAFYRGKRGSEPIVDANLAESSGTFSETLQKNMFLSVGADFKPATTNSAGAVSNRLQTLEQIPLRLDQCEREYD
jgi:hypothetical protein